MKCGENCDIINFILYHGHIVPDDIHSQGGTNMSINVVNKKKGKAIIYVAVTFVLLSALFLLLASYLYTDAENRAMETLHIQTKQIKDDLTLQLLSDRENLATMANFASKLYLDGGDYSLLFESFKPIGLISDIVILTPDNTFITKSSSVNLDGRVSFSEDARQGTFITGRIKEATVFDYERVRSAVPIVANGKTVGMLYGIIRLEDLERRYLNIATELDAQLFIYHAATGDLIVDSIHDELGNISFLKDREYNATYSYEQFVSSDKGFTSFQSAYKDENVLMHYSLIEDLNWRIALVRYDSQVYAETHTLMMILMVVLISIIVIMGVLSTLMTMDERRKNSVIDCASNIRRILIEASGNNNVNNNSINEALKSVGKFTMARSVIFFDADNADYNYISPEFRSVSLPEAKRNVLKAELLRYVSELVAQDSSALQVIRLRQNDKLEKAIPTLYSLLNEYDIAEIFFSAAVNHLNHITILAIINPKRKADAFYLAEKVSACFTIALNNHNILNKTKLAATTDSLTGTLNRVAYNNDMHIINEERPLDFACIYVDVNELHARNNKFGHAAGDEMLLFIAHTLKDVFFGHKVYRMGGDEFLVFAQGAAQDDIKKGIDIFLESLKPRDYHVAIGMSFRSQNTNTEEMVREAEIRMYEAKAKYYQNKEMNANASAETEFVQVKVGIPEIDTMISILKENYNGIYRVSLDTDRASRVLMPSYLKYNETEEHFSRLFANYVSESADSDYHRSLLSFQNYDALKQQLSEGKTPKVTYKKLNGETVTLSVYKLSESPNNVSDTLWIFAKK